MSMNFKTKDIQKSYMKHLNNMPVNFGFNTFPDFGYLPSSYVNPLSSYGVGLGLGVGVGYGVGSGPLKKGDIISGDQLTFYDPLNPYNNNTISLSGVSGVSGVSGLANLVNTVKIYSNSEISVNIVGTEADCTKVVKILDKMYTDHKAEIATL
jgi:hypothetical protein